MNDCIFCKLANGEIPTATLYEDDDFRVILDAAPASRGHSLIIPKAHAENLLDLPEDTLQKAALLAKKIGGCLMKAMGADGFNVVQNNFPAAGQTVFHFHIHLIPAYEGNPGIVSAWPHTEITDGDKEEIIKAVNALSD